MSLFSLHDIAKHTSPQDCLTVIDGIVYDMGPILDSHPGGRGVLLTPDVAGQDCSKLFFALHRSEILADFQHLIVGKVRDAVPNAFEYPTAGTLSLVPHAEPGWLSKGYKSPYYDASHYALQAATRLFFDTEVKRYAREWEASGQRPSLELMELMGKEGVEINAMRMGPGKHLRGRKLLGAVDGDKFDYFHELVVIQELVRIGSPGAMAGLNAGMVIGLPPVLNFGDDKMQAEVLPGVLSGKTFISLAISEAAAGSDVNGMTTRATKTPCGKFYEVTGAKKWITNGHFSDWFMTGVRTSETQLSMLLIKRDDTVETKKIATSYSASAGTATVFFEKTLVPIENLLGGEGNGLKVILSNFNHERWVICCRIVRNSRSIYEETFRYAHLPTTNGTRLIDDAVVRLKFANMLTKIDAGQTWLEQITYQMCTMNYKEQSKRLGGPTALLKWYLSKTAGEISSDASQIWGERGLIAGGMGVYIEQFQRTYKFDSILGGSEEVLADLGTRQAMRFMPRAVL